MPMDYVHLQGSYWMISLQYPPVLGMFFIEWRASLVSTSAWNFYKRDRSNFKGTPELVGKFQQEMENGGDGIFKRAKVA